MTIEKFLKVAEFRVSKYKKIFNIWVWQPVFVVFKDGFIRFKIVKDDFLYKFDRNKFEKFYINLWITNYFVFVLKVVWESKPVIIGVIRYSKVNSIILERTTINYKLDATKHIF